MHITRRKRAKLDGSLVARLYLRETFRPGGGQPRERSLHLGSEKATDLWDRSAQRLRKAGYTAAQIKAIVASIHARVDRDQHLPIQVRGKPVAWRDPKK